MRLMWGGSQAVRICTVMANGWRDVISFLWFCFSGLPKELAALEEKERGQIWGHEMRPRTRKKIQRNFKRETGQLEKQGTHGSQIRGKQGSKVMLILATEKRVWGTISSKIVTTVTTATHWGSPSFLQHCSLSCYACDATSRVCEDSALYHYFTKT